MQEMSLRGKVWKEKTYDSQISRGIEKYGIPLVASQLMAARGVTPDAALAFWQPSLADMPDPFTLSGVWKAAVRLVEALAKMEKVVVWLDYDVDGITSGTLLVRFFREIGMDVDYYVPSRQEEGYGLNCEGIEFLAKTGAEVIVTVDCGVTSVVEAELAKSLGVDLIITDHHTPPEGSLPDAFAVINPLLPGDQYPFKHLAGVGVAFNLAVVMRSELRNQGYFDSNPQIDMKKYLSLVALGTVADVMPLTGANRIFVKHGLVELQNSNDPGIIALKTVSGIKDTIKAWHLGFSIGPRLNASGRLASAKAAVELLLTDDHETAHSIAADLNVLNEERRDIEAKIVEEAIAMVENTPGMKDQYCLVLASEGWNHGVIGIASSRLVEKYHRPTILIGLDENGVGRGSCRSVSKLHLYNAIKECEEHLIKFGGHKHAAGLSIQASSVAAFADAMERTVRNTLKEEDLIPEMEFDLSLHLEDVSMGLLSEIQKLEPFGAGNPEPLIVVKNVTPQGHKILKQKHLKFEINSPNGKVEAIGFNMAENFASMRAFDLAFSIDVNEWNGRSTLQMKLKDIR